jgi:hypothetical protein
MKKQQVKIMMTQETWQASKTVSKENKLAEK